MLIKLEVVKRLHNWIKSSDVFGAFCRIVSAFTYGIRPATFWPYVSGRYELLVGVFCVAGWSQILLIVFTVTSEVFKTCRWILSHPVKVFFCFWAENDADKEDIKSLLLSGALKQSFPLLFKQLNYIRNNGLFPKPVLLLIFLQQNIFCSQINHC